MTSETMTIHKALCELKTLDEIGRASWRERVCTDV